MNNFPLVSIITSTLNAGEHLQKTIDSIRRQQYKNIEYIVVDGGSTDSTIEVAKTFRDCISSFISESDTGIYDAWNKGLRLANGKYIAFLGAGDEYLESGLANLVSCAIANPRAEFISSKIACVREEALFRTLGSAWSWVRFKHYMNAAHAGSLHDRSLFEKFGTFDTNFKIAGDYEFLLRAGPNLQTAFLDEVAVKMAWGGVSQTNKRRFSETELAKLKNKSVSRSRARFDRSVAEIKSAVRGIVGR